MKKVRYLAGAAGLVPAAVAAVIPAAAHAATPPPAGGQKVVALHHAAPDARCHTTKSFRFSTRDNNRLRGHGWYRPETGGFCIGTIVISMKYNKSLSKGAYVFIDPGDPFASERVHTGRHWEPKGTWLRWSFGINRVFTGPQAGLSLWSSPYGELHKSFDHATLVNP